MSEPTPRFREIFFELYEGLPRQGPGNRACAEKALGLCRDLSPTPAVLDLGCGVGGQTLHLVELVSGAVITAMDSHAPSIARLRATVAMLGREAEAASAWDLAAEVYEFDVTLAREDGEWRVTRADWARAGLPR